MRGSHIIILTLVVCISLFGINSAFADPHGIETADNDLAVPGCGETSVGCYTPNTMTVDVGHIVTMTNADEAGIHTFTSGTVDGFAASPDGTFDTGMLMAGESYDYNADTVGEFPYYCSLHVWMQGVLIVQEVAAEEEMVMEEVMEEPEPTPEPTYPNPAPYGTDVVIPRGTGVPGCEETRSCYDPYGIAVAKYSTITWYNADSVAHTVTSGSPGSGGSGEFDSSLFMPGESFSHEFSRDGTFNYFCMVHPWMEGQVIVKRGIVTEPPTYDTTPPKILKPTDITVDAENNNGARVSYDVLVIDETDQIVRPSCSPSSGSYFAIGTTKVTCNASDSAGNRAQSVSFSITVNPLDVAIPDWVKNVASFWCEDKIDDSSFIEGIEYLIDNNIIIVSASSGYGSSQEIPNWVKNNACWWSEGLITDKDFASGIEYLVREGIIRV